MLLLNNPDVLAKNNLFIGNKVFNSKGQENKTSSFKDISNNSTINIGDNNIVNVDSGDTPKETVDRILGKKNVILTDNYSNIKVGVNDEILKTIPIKPEGMADNKY